MAARSAAIGFAPAASPPPRPCTPRRSRRAGRQRPGDRGGVPPLARGGPRDRPGSPGRACRTGSSSTDRPGSGCWRSSHRRSTGRSRRRGSTERSMELTSRLGVCGSAASGWSWPAAAAGTAETVARTPSRATAAKGRLIFIGSSVEAGRGWGEARRNAPPAAAPRDDTAGWVVGCGPEPATAARPGCPPAKLPPLQPKQPVGRGRPLPPARVGRGSRG